MNQSQTISVTIGSSADFVSNGMLNRAIGWAMMIAALAYAAWLDPQAYHRGDFPAALGSPVIFLTHAQTMAIEIALLQLLTAHTLSLTALAHNTRRTLAELTAIGGILTAAGFAGAAHWANSLWLIIFGSLLQVSGFVVLVKCTAAGKDWRAVRAVFVIICCALLLEAAAALFKLEPTRFAPSYLGPDDGLRMRLFRLAQVAALTLPMLSFLYRGLTSESGPSNWLYRWGHIAMLSGAIGMPAVLITASFTYVELKGLLVIPACAVLAATLAGAWLARAQARPLECVGWTVITLSMAAGMVMGLYAFATPPSALQFLAVYTDDLRRLIRLSHAYSIVCALLLIFLGREIDKLPGRARRYRLGVGLLAVGVPASFATILIGGSATGWLAPILALGPVLVALALGLCLGVPAKSTLLKLLSYPQRIVGGAS